MSHLRHHGRFYLALACGIAAGVLPLPFYAGDAGERATIGGATFFLIYLASTAVFARRVTADELRKRAGFDDEGIVLIVLITLAAIALSLGSLALLLGGDRTSVWRLLPAIANVPLGWATLHTIMAFHYAHLFYSRPDERGGDAPEARGLDFPKTDEPGISDFVYYSFVVGMTAQVSDVQTTSRAMRRATLTHGVVSFFFNTVILALTVNVVVRG